MFAHDQACAFWNMIRSARCYQYVCCNNEYKLFHMIVIVVQSHQHSWQAPLSMVRSAWSKSCFLGNRAQKTT